MENNEKGTRNALQFKKVFSGHPVACSLDVVCVFVDWGRRKEPSAILSVGAFLPF